MDLKNQYSITIITFSTMNISLLLVHTHTLMENTTEKMVNVVQYVILHDFSRSWFMN